MQFSFNNRRIWCRPKKEFWKFHKLEQNCIKYIEYQKSMKLAFRWKTFYWKQICEESRIDFINKLNINIHKTFDIPFYTFLTLIFQRDIISYHWITTQEAGAEGSMCKSVICEGMEEKSEEKNTFRRKISGILKRVESWLWLGAAKNTSEEFKAGGDSRLKTPLSSREPNSNVRHGRKRESTRRREKTAQCVRIFK